MNKNALNKNLQLFFVTLFIGAFIYSCKKDKLNNEDSTTISQVQTWFKEQTSSRPITTSLFTQNSGTRKISSLKSSVGVQVNTNIGHHVLSINWKNAKTYTISDSIIFEIPITSSGIFKFDTKILTPGDTIRLNKSITRFLFIKTATKTEGYFMTIISDDKYLTDTSSDPDKNTFLKKELNFSGTIVYHDLQGNMTNVVSVNKQAQLYKTASRARFSSKGKLSAAYPDQCTETPIYEVIGVNCYDIGSYYTYCQNVYSVYVGHTICGNGGGSGPGGNGSGGGSGGGPGSNPTPSTPSSRRITNNVNNQCLSAGVDMARNANTKIKNMLNLTFGGSEYTDHDINFYDVTTLPSTTDGATTPRNQYTFDINLNANTLPQRSKEYILSTVYHEVLHAYLFSKYPKDGSGRLIMPDQHETMANNYVSLMTDALKLAYPNISNQEAWALSWGGLQETPFYTSKLSSEERSEIESINNKHRKSASNRLGTYCN